MIDISVGIKLFNDGEYFAAHDFFEDIWIGISDDSRLFYQGLIQVSVGCYHLVCGNYRGSLSQFDKGTAKLENYLPEYRNVYIDKLLAEVKVLCELLEGNTDKQKIEFDITLLPKIKLKFN